MIGYDSYFSEDPEIFAVFYMFPDEHIIERISSHMSEHHVVQFGGC